jgi:hypothetical protein
MNLTEQSALPTFKETVKDMGGQKPISTSQQNMHSGSAGAGMQVLSGYRPARRGEGLHLVFPSVMSPL